MDYSSLSPVLVERLKAAQDREATYLPNKRVSQLLKAKELILLVAPTAQGKSTIMNELSMLDNEFSFTTGWTTRPPAERDLPGALRYFNTPAELEELATALEEGEVIQYVVHPTTGHMYGTFIEDYRSEYNTIDTLANSVAGFERLPFRAITKVGLVSSGEDWQQRLLQRYPEPNDERNKRVNEAILCIQWLLAQPPKTIIWIANRTSTGPRKTAEDIIAIVKDHQKHDENHADMARQMLTLAKELQAK